MSNFQSSPGSKRESSFEISRELSNDAPIDLDDLDAEYGQFKNAEHSDATAGRDLTSEYGAQFAAEFGGEPGSGSGSGSGFPEAKPVAPAAPGNVPSALYEFHERPVTVGEFYSQNLRSTFTLATFTNYLRSLLPIMRWLPHYNARWLYQDLVAGITVGCVLVPQSMSYAQIATLSPQYGLYSSFVGAFIYSFFATSKDVCIGPVAVMSLQTAKAISHVVSSLPEDTEITSPMIATALALLCGIISLGLGVLRLGFLVELISSTAVAGFMTGSALNIIAGQVPALMGYNKLVNTRTSTYKVIINSLRHLPDTKLDAVFGLVPLVILYVWKWGCSTGGPRLVQRYGSRRSRMWDNVFLYTQALRNAVVIVVFTAIAWGMSHRALKEGGSARISLLGTVPSGLKDVGVMKVPSGLLSKIAPELPASVIVLVLEHIAISKAFGRVNDYRVVPDQELIAIGATNLIGTFFNAYPATGSFSRSALKAKCNVSTPLSGLFSGACVLLAIYCLTSAFKFIPKATLSAVIIHAVSDLIASYKTTWSFWRLSPPDLVCFLVTVVITVFSSIENGIYFAMCWSVAVLLFRTAFPAGKFLGRVQIAEARVTNSGAGAGVGMSSGNSAGTAVNREKERETTFTAVSVSSESLSHTAPGKAKSANSAGTDKLGKVDGHVTDGGSPRAPRFHTKWVPFDRYTRELNPEVFVAPPPPGVIVFRPSESWTYVNCSRQYDAIFDEVVRLTRRGRPQIVAKSSSRPWNDPGEWHPPKFLRKLFKSSSEDLENRAVARDERPVLRVIAMDWSQVAQVDSTGLQTLQDLRKAVNKYADRQVEFHFAGIIEPWVKRGLINSGFGTVNDEFADESLLVGHKSCHIARSAEPTEDEESRLAHPATGTNLPFFHLELPDFSEWDYSD